MLILSNVVATLLLILCIFENVSGIWHGYNDSIMAGSMTRLMNPFEVIPASEHKQKRLWPHIADLNQGNESLYGYAYGLRKIWEHQFPSDGCKDKKFIISGGKSVNLCINIYA